ncbi:MAG: aminopeptidase P N-terminal domain-containing protein [Verrucomicrobia bacterium]|nr:aminopeptidase P N-terminal domain-containing protein [Verrucomicrobiota bacterium]
MRFLFVDNPFIERRNRVASALGLKNELLLIGAGQPVALPENTDQTYPFRSHSEYFYLTGNNFPGGVLAFDPKDGAAGWVSFVPEVSDAERTWEGRVQPEGTPIAALEPWLTNRRARPVVFLGEPIRGVVADPTLTGPAREKFKHARRAKDGVEIDTLHRAVRATVAGFSALREAIRPGVTERQLQIELEAGFFRGGADRTGYETIIGTGSNSAILHFPPSKRPTATGDLLLVDAGAEVDRYVIDVTRTYVVGSNRDPFLRDLYQIVLAAEEAGIAGCILGAEWKELHLRISIQITEGLVQLGLLRGTAETLVEQGAHQLFFPHGLGHLVGLGVRDASGLLPGRQRDENAKFSNLRMDLPLEENYVTTVEPGVYFIPVILNSPTNREKYQDCVNWELAEGHLNLGGIRIEDNVLVTKDGPVVLTSEIPKAW